MYLGGTEVATYETGKQLCSDRSFSDHKTCIGEFLRTLPREVVVLYNKENGDMVMIAGETLVAEYNSGLHLLRLGLSNNAVVLMNVEKGKLMSFSVKYR